MPRAKKPETATGPVVKPFAFYWRDTDRDHVSVGHNLWPGDRFEVINRTDFQRLKMWAKRFNIPMVDENGDEPKEV